MKYRVGYKEDHAQIKGLVDSTGYYNSIDPAACGGRWVVAEHEGKLHACAWVMLEQPNAYIDYWVGTGRTAARLLAMIQKTLKKHGVKLVRAVIHESNKSAIRLACHGLGAWGSTGYVFVAKEITNGTEDNDDQHDS